MKKKIFSLGFIALLIALPFAVKAATSFDGMQSGNVIKLTEDVTLSKKHVINEGESLTIDLNGHTLTGPTDNYLVDNKGTVKIIDTGSNKGKISCPSNTSSCLRNLGTMEIDGITVESAFAAVKNDAENDYYGNLTVKNATLISTRTGSTSVGFTGVLQNWGSAIVDNTTITATENEYAVFARSGSATNTDSTITISNSTLTGSYFVVQERDGSNQTTQTVNISNSTLNGQAKGNKSTGAISSYSGDITVTTNKPSVNNVVVANSKPGTKITFDMDYNTTLAIPEGVTVIIPEGRVLTVKLNGVKVGDGKLELQGKMEGAGAYLENANAYYPTLQNAIRYGVSSKGTDTVKLLDNTKETSKIDVNQSKNITVDLNGYTVDGTNSIIIANNGTLTIKDTSKGQTGKVNTTITNSGKLTIKGGTYQTIPTTNAGATTTVEGGTFPKEILDQVTVNENQTVTTNEDGTVTIAYKKADYDKVEEAIDKANKLNKNDYKNFSLVEDAINKVDWNKNITEQKEVDKYAEDILKAIDSLELKDKEDIKDEATNPKTSDSIILVAVIGGIAVIVAVTAFIILKKKA